MREKINCNNIQLQESRMSNAQYRTNMYEIEPFYFNVKTKDGKPILHNGSNTAYSIISLVTQIRIVQ